MASTGDTRRRAAALGLPLGLCIFIAAQLAAYRPHDVEIGLRASKALLDGQLDLYARLPEAQMGPLSLLLAGLLPRPVYVIVVAALLLALLRVAAATGGLRALAIGGALLAWPWALYALEGHADDALVATSAAVMVFAFRRSPPLVAAAFVVAVAAKPTAVLLLPLLILTSRRATCWGLAASAAVWSPFVLADASGFLSAGGGIATVQPWSLPGLLGAPPGAEFPTWVRPVQFVGGMALCWVLAVTRGAAAAVLAAVTWRALWEPGGAPSYSVAVIAAALVFDVTRGRSARFPLMAFVAFSTWFATYAAVRLHFDYAEPTAPLGLLRGGLLVGLIVAAALSEFENRHARVVGVDGVGAAGGGQGRKHLERSGARGNAGD